MNRLSGIFALFILICCSVAGFASAQEATGVGEPEVIATIANESIGERTLLVVPDGGGKPLSQSRTPWGEISDATITAQILDLSLDPIVNFPREDIWLDGYYGSPMVFCPAGTIADQDTDSNGLTHWTLPLHAGGWNQDGLFVYVNGAVLHQNTLLLTTNSPDINGDLGVTLADVAVFAGDFFGAFQFRSDLHRDGDLNLLDLTVLAGTWGANCP